MDKGPNANLWLSQLVIVT